MGKTKNETLMLLTDYDQRLIYGGNKHVFELNEKDIVGNKNVRRILPEVSLKI